MLGADRDGGGDALAGADCSKSHETIEPIALNGRHLSKVNVRLRCNAEMSAYLLQIASSLTFPHFRPGKGEIIK